MKNFVVLLCVIFGIKSYGADMQMNGATLNCCPSIMSVPDSNDEDMRSLEADYIFRVGSTALSATPELRRFASTLDSLNRDSLVRMVNIYGKASPEGRAEFNQSLGRGRAIALRNFISSESSIPDSVVALNAVGEDWNGLKENLYDCVSADKARVVADIIENEPDLNAREKRIRAIDGGVTWNALLKSAFPPLRKATVIVEYVSMPESNEDPEPAEQAIEEIESQPVLQPEPAPEAEAIVEAVPAASGCQKGWHVSTNAIEWGLLIANATGEWDFQCHWSLAASLHYSAMNYFTSTRKFRTFILRPEARYWFSDAHAGLFVDAHVQMASYNFALSHWSYRIQDFDGKHPALGGGIGCGYRMPVGTNGHWALQAQIGVGAYHLKYNKFENKPNDKLVSTRSRNWCGIDNVALSIVYNFNVVNQ